MTHHDTSSTIAPPPHVEPLADVFNRALQVIASAFAQSQVENKRLQGLLELQQEHAVDDGTSTADNIALLEEVARLKVFCDAHDARANSAEACVDRQMKNLAYCEGNAKALRESIAQRDRLLDSADSRLAEYSRKLAEAEQTARDQAIDLQAARARADGLQALMSETLSASMDTSAGVVEEISRARAQADAANADRDAWREHATFLMQSMRPPKLVNVPADAAADLDAFSAKLREFRPTYEPTPKETKAAFAEWSDAVSSVRNLTRSEAEAKP